MLQSSSCHVPRQKVDASLSRKHPACSMLAPGSSQRCFPHTTAAAAAAHPAGVRPTLLARLVTGQASISDNKQWRFDVAGLDAGPALAAAAAAAASQHQHQQQQEQQLNRLQPRTSLFSRGSSSSSSSSISQGVQHQQPQQQQQQQQRHGQQLVRPVSVAPQQLRRLLQQQVDSASSCGELAELLVGRRQQLTLKHLAGVVRQVRGTSMCVCVGGGAEVSLVFVESLGRV